MREEDFVCMFCGRASHLDEFCFWRKRIEMRRLDYARNSYRDEFIDFPSCFFSRASPHTSSYALFRFSHGPNHPSYSFVHERTTLCLGALVTVHVLIVAIVSHVGPVFLLEDLRLTQSLDTWMVHVFPIMVHVPLGQVMRC
jgi:hypothetical protein